MHFSPVSDFFNQLTLYTYIRQQSNFVVTVHALVVETCVCCDMIVLRFGETNVRIRLQFRQAFPRLAQHSLKRSLFPF
jgi:hypothetical protein